jgi:hypothetical protein
MGPFWSREADFGKIIPNWDATGPGGYTQVVNNQIDVNWYAN